MSPLLNEETLRQYEALEGVIVKVLQPTNDNLKALTEEVREIKVQLSDKYYSKEMVDALLSTIRDDINELKARTWQTLAGAAALTAIVGFAVQHIH